MTPKEQYDARQKLKRIARGDEPEELTTEELAFNMFYGLAERFVTAFEKIAARQGGEQ